jgi:hypothetical protein
MTTQRKRTEQCLPAENFAHNSLQSRRRAVMNRVTPRSTWSFSRSVVYCAKVIANCLYDETESFAREFSETYRR